MELVSRFANLVRRPAAAIPLDEAALVIAACGQADLSIEAELGQLDEIASAVTAGSLDSLTRLLFETLGFHGNQADYYDPRNSFLNEVIARRTGIPITLAVALIEIGRRADVELFGIGMPGHFLVRDSGDPDLFIDVFGGGRRHSSASCRALFHQLHGPAAPFHTGYLDPIGHDLVLRRMLANLRAVYSQREDAPSLLWVLELATQFRDAPAEDHRALAIALTAQGAYDRAAESYERAAAQSEIEHRDGAPDLQRAVLARARLN